MSTVLTLWFDWRSLLLASAVAVACTAPRPVGAAETLDCLVMPRRTADLAFGSPGVIRALDVDRGDRVRAGQRLASLDTTVEQANLDIARAQLDTTAALESAQAQLEVLTKRLERSRILLAQQTLATGRFEEIKGEYDVARLKVSELMELRALRRLDVGRAEAVLALRTITATFGGVVVERHVLPGEYVDNKRVLTVSEIDPVYVDVIAPASLFGAVKQRTPIRIGLEQPGGRTIEAAATVVDPYVDASSMTFRVRALVPNPDLSITPGFRCRAEFVLVGQ